ncbi:MAG: oxidoreductase [Opitutae bacterium]|nr:oxidoreductase [Opitutae bacterium]|tara:strand:+ start:882 stop:1880 length:999 start_codon:yes stop_codon:yes gene_type:complete
MNDITKIALVGCGYWGKNLCRNFHALNALARVVDATESGQAQARLIAPRIKVSSHFEDALNDTQIQAVAIATPAETHAELAIKAMKAGKDVYVEKPMALSVEDAERMKAVADQTESILMVGHLLEYHPAVLKLRELIDSSELGKINYVYSNRLSFGKVRTEENALWSFAPHDVAVILRLLGQSPVEIAATGGSYLTKGLVDATVSNLRFKDESRAHIFVSWLHPFKEQRLVVVGEKKMAIFNDVVPYGEKLLLYPQTVEFDGKVPVLKKEDCEPIEYIDVEPLREECRHFLDCVTNRSKPLTDAQSGIEVLKVLHACQSSIDQNGIPVSLSQ